MNVFIVVLESVLILLGIGFIGFWITQRKILPESALSFLSRLAIDIALPSVVFASIMVNFSPKDYPNWWQLPLWWVLFTAIILVFTLGLRYLSARQSRPEFAVSLLYQNGIFLPLIILSGIYGPENAYIPQLFIFVMLHPTLVFSTYSLFFRKKAETAPEPRWHRIINPVLIATIIAIIVQLAGVKTYLPDFIVSIFDILGAMALPLVMIILGGSLYLDFQQKGKFYFSEVAKFVAVKNIVFPVAMIGVLLLLRPSYNIALLFLLQAAVPPISGVPVLAERAGGKKSIATQFVFSSFVASVVTIPGVLLLFSVFFPSP